MEFREAIERDALDLLALAARAAAETGQDPLDGALQRDLAALGNDYLAQERHLDDGGADTAAGMAQRRPSAGRREPEKPARTARSRGCPAARACISATSATSTCRSWRIGERPMRLLRPAGRATWSSSAAARPPSRASCSSSPRPGATSGRLSVAHAGAYFETTALLAAWPRRTFRPIAGVGGECRRGDRRTGLVRRLLRRHGSACRAPDTSCCSTPRWSGPSHDLGSCLAAAADDCEVAIAFSSGLKLDQAGLELANVGIARVLVRDGARQRAPRSPAG